MSAKTTDDTQADDQDDATKATASDTPHAPDDSDVSHGQEAGGKDEIPGEGTIGGSGTIGKSDTIGGEGLAPPVEDGAGPAKDIVGEGTASGGGGLLPTPGGGIPDEPDDIIGESAPGPKSEDGEESIDKNEIISDDGEDDDDDDIGELDDEGDA